MNQPGSEKKPILASDSNETQENEIRELLNYAGVAVDPDALDIERLRKLRNEQQEFIDNILNK